MPKGTIGGGTMGRPTKYSADMVKRGYQYLKECEDGSEIIVVGEKKNKKGKIVKQYGTRHRVRLPMIEGLALYLGINKDTVQEWKKQHTDFSVLIGDLLSLQAQRLAENGLGGTYNATISKVLLSKHGYREGLEHTGDGGSALFRPDGKDKDAADKALDDL